MQADMDDIILKKSEKTKLPLTSFGTLGYLSKSSSVVEGAEGLRQFMCSRSLTGLLVLRRSDSSIQTRSQIEYNINDNSEKNYYLF